MALVTTVLSTLLCVVPSPAHPAAAGSVEDQQPRSATSAPRWHASWATAQDSAGMQLRRQTVRTIVRLTQGGTAVRLSFAHHVSTGPITVTRVAVGRRDGDRGMQPGTVHQVTFSGAQSLTLRPGRSVVSDPVRLPVRAQRDLVVDAFVAGQATPSAHRSAYDDSYLSPAGSGDRSGEPSGASFSQTATSFLMLSSVDVLSSDIEATVAVVGGSVVDGQGSRQTGTLGLGPAAPPHSRWSDVLARRFLAARPADRQVSVVNAGIGANTVARRCATSSSTTGNVQTRFARDVLRRAGLTHVIVYAGTNDIGMPLCTAQQILVAYRDLIRRAHRRGVEIFFATITPRVSYTPVQNASRRTVNRWLLRGGDCSGLCDGVFDFDAAIAWPSHPDAIDPALDSGDTVHPNAGGYRRLAGVIPLRAFA